MSWTWQGRQLTKAVKDKTVTFTYDSEGIRTSKSDGTNTTKYLLNGTQILAQTTNGKTLCFFYDQQGNRVGMADGKNNFYYYIYNVQGDVIALADASTGKLVVTYTYDAWGKLVKLEDTTANSVGTQNPFRYRGYYYDTETGLYYLLTRYYDPEVGRFISADAFTSTDISSPLSANMFAYCENNPVHRSDSTGEFFDIVFDVISLGLSIRDVVNNPSDPWAWAGLVGDVIDLVPLVSGVGESVKAVNAARKTVKKATETSTAVKKGWKVGDDVSNLTKAGKTPSWSTVRQRYWKNQAYYNPGNYTATDLSRMSKGRAPIGKDGFSMELHHPNGRKGDNFFDFYALTRTEHRAIHYGPR